MELSRAIDAAASACHPMCIVAFDLLWLNGEDLRPLPFVEREAWLRRLLRRRANHIITEALAIEKRGKALMVAVEAHDLEGKQSARAIPMGAASSGGRS